jgi:HEAT repeat protein
MKTDKKFVPERGVARSIGRVERPTRLFSWMRQMCRQANVSWRTPELARVACTSDISRWIWRTLLMTSIGAMTLLPAGNRGSSQTAADESQVVAQKDGDLGRTPANDSKVLVQSLTKKLSNNDPIEREEAAGELEKLGASVNASLKPAISALGLHLQDKDEGVRLKAAKALVAMGPLAAEANGYLSRALKDENKEVRRTALSALWQLRENAGVAVPNLVELLRDDDIVVRRMAASILGYVGPRAKAAVPALVKALKDPDEGVGQDMQGSVSHVAVFSLEAIGPAAHAAIPALLEESKINGSHLQLYAIRALGSVACADKTVLAALMEFVKDKVRPEVRIAAGRALTRIGPDAKDALPLLLEALQDKETRGRAGASPLRASAAQALAAIDIEGKVAVPAFMAVLTDRETDGELRNSIFAALERLGPGGKPAIPQLAELMKNGSTARARDGAAKVLTSIGADAVPVLIEALKNGDPVIRDRALLALWHMGPAAKTAAPDLLSLWEAPNSLVLIPNVKVPLAAMGSAAVPALVQGLKSPHRSVRVTALLVLSDMGSAGREAVPALIKYLDDTDPQIRLLAAQALGSVGPSANDAIPSLQRACKDSEPRVAQQAAVSLRSIQRR